MIVIGDLRDVVKNLVYLIPGGEDPDWVNFGLALTGLALDVGEFFSAGADTPVNFAVAFFKTLLKKLQEANAAVGYARRTGAVFSAIVVSLLKEWRAGAFTAQLGLTAWSLWGSIQDLWEYLIDDLDIPQLVVDLTAALRPAGLPQAAGAAADVAKFLTRVEALLALLENPGVRSLNDLRHVGGLLLRLKRAGLSPREIARLARALKRGGYSNETLRAIARAVTRRYGPGATPRLTRKAVLGLAEFAQANGAAATNRLLKRRFPRTEEGEKALFRLLTNIDTAKRVAVREGQPRALDKLTRRLTFGYGSFLGAYHELDAVARYRRRIQDLGTVFNGEGVDYVLTTRRAGFEEWLECKGYVTTNPFFVKRNAKKVRRQFIRFARRWRRENPPDVPLMIRYLFRGSYREGREYYKALLSAVQECRRRGIVPPDFKLPRSRVEFLGLPRP
jgi:hypothetical protein